jgi:hypothetical protein
MRTRLYCLAVLLLGAVSRVAVATTYGSTTIASGTGVNLYLDYDISRVCIYTSGGGSAANIGAVYVAHSGATARSSELQVILMDRPANLSFPGRNDNLSPVATNWGGIIFDSGTADWATVSGSISGNLTGTVSANKIVRIEVGGELSAAATATTTGTAIAWMELGSSTSAGTVSAANGDIDTVNATATTSAIAGAISADNGSIGTVVANGGISIASSTGIRARDGIGSIVSDHFTTFDAWKPVDASITANYDPDHSPSYYIGELGQLACSDLSGSVQAYNLPTTGSSAPVIAVHGDLAATLNVDNEVDSDIIVDGGMTSPANIQIHGDLHGSIGAFGGSITTLWIGGNVSAPANSAIYIYSDDTIDTLTIVGEVGADTSVDGHEVTLVAQTITSFTAQNFLGEIRGTGFVHPNASFGTVNIAEDMGGNFEIGGFDEINVGGLVEIVNDGDKFTIASFPSGKLLRVGYLAHDVEVSGTFNGQVICTGGWSGTFKYRDESNDLVALATIPFYDNTRADLNGGTGAVGLVPYHLHSTDCEPVNSGVQYGDMPTSSWPDSPATRETIVLRFYGPVIDSSPGGSIPVKVYRQSMLCGSPCPPAWECISSDCTVAAGQGPGGREVWVCMTPGETAVPFDRDYNYKITPRDDGDGHTDLRSANTLAETDPNIGDFEYTFTLTIPPEYRSEGGGGTTPAFYTVDDLDYLLSIDINGDGTVDSLDTEEVLERLGLN